MSKPDYINWIDFKQFVDDRKLSIQETDLPGNLRLLEVYDGNNRRSCRIDITSTDWTDYVANYQASANKTSTDKDGINLVRIKQTNSGNFYQLHCINYKTADKDSWHNKNIDNSDLGYCSMKFYDASDNELTTQVAISLSCVRTDFFWQPTHNVEIFGGRFIQKTPPLSEAYMWIRAVPDYPSNQGGSVDFVEGGFPLHLMNDNFIFELDGKTPHEMPYNGGIGTNKFLIRVRHSVGSQINMVLFFDIYKPGVS